MMPPPGLRIKLQPLVTLNFDLVTPEVDHSLIREGPALRTPNCIRKTRNTFSETWLSVPLPKFWEKSLLRAKFHWNRTIGCRGI